MSLSLPSKATSAVFSGIFYQCIRTPAALLEAPLPLLVLEGFFLEQTHLAIILIQMVQLD
jgi:hypothetical protein